MAVVMRNGLPDMRSMQEDIESVEEEEEKEAEELDTVGPSEVKKCRVK